MKRSAFVVLVCTVFAHTAPIAEEWVLTEIDEPFVQHGRNGSSDDAELGEHFEGDILLTPSQKELIFNTDIIDRNGLKNITKRWPNQTVVYHIVEEDFDERELKMIEDGMNDIGNNSCIKFRPGKKNEHIVTIQGSQGGCFSNVGFTAKDEDESEEEVRQVLNLASGCFKHGTIVHEMLHTIGFYHMQSTFNRDDYVEIIWENIRPGIEHNFAKYMPDTVTDFGVPYDYESVMHYPEFAFSKNGNKTIIPLQENVKIGQRNGLSQSDTLKLLRMYCEE